MAQELDIDQPLTDEEAKATAYFEDEWSQDIAALNDLITRVEALENP